MTNMLAIAHKELKSYFASPIAYVLLGVFAVLYGWFFAAILLFFERQSSQMGMMGMGPQNVNLNQQLIRPVLMNVSVIMLFILPLITMRSYAEEKRSGTIELLLTSPLTDVQIVVGKFLGAMGLIATMLAITLPHLGLLSLYSDPEWRPLMLAYLGYLLMTGCFVAVDTPDNLTARLRGSESMYVQVDGGNGDVRTALESVPGVTRVAVADTRERVVGFEVDSAKGRDVRRELATAIVTRGWGLLELRPMRMSLEEIFLSLTTEEKPAEREPREAEDANG